MSLRILCIDDDPDFLTSLRFRICKQCEMFEAISLAEGVNILERESLDLVIIDFDLGSEDGVAGIRQIKEMNPKLDIVMLTARREPEVVVQAMKAGATDYLTKPCDFEKLLAIMTASLRASKARDRYEAIVASQNATMRSRQIIYRSPPFKRVMQQAEQLKGHIANVLISGETGTGKELLARYIHSLEEGRDRPFVAVNCAAIPEQLIEAELFGAERGAYTGAHARRIGQFELADGGDIFLDEVGTLKPDLQTKILRVLQEKEFSRVGGGALIQASFRVIAATNEKLEQMVQHGEFRMDLYHRLRVIQLLIPPLRERTDDIPELVQHFLQKYTKPGAQAKRLSAAALDKLKAYHWPGNVRELENVIQSLVILCPEEMIELQHLPAWALNGVGSPPAADNGIAVPSIDRTVTTLRQHTLRMEKSYIEYVLTQSGGDKSKAARILDVGRTTLYSKLREYGLL